MKNKILLLIFMLFCFVNVSASAYRTTANLNFRTTPNTNGSIITTIEIGSRVTFVEESTSGNGCDDKWVKITYNDKTGYVCSTYLIEISDPKPVEPEIKCTQEETTSIIEECNDETCSMVETVSIIETCSIVEPELKPMEYTEESLRAMGFSDGYISKLLKIHEQHPYWRFSPQIVNYDFMNLVNMEHNSSGRSLIEDLYRTRDGLKSTATWSYNYKTNNFSTSFIGGGNSWYAASTDTIAYYMDPRNFLNEKQIFMFEQNSFNPELHTLDGIVAMLKGSFMDNKKADDTHTCAQAFLDAAVKYNVSPYLLISRVIQEVGKNGSTIVQGMVSGYEGYYNFYNINAYGSTSSETIRNGLAHAKKMGWDTWYKAIVGGADFLAGGYISIGQDTEYLQKWDIIGEMGTHQYMQNIEAPSNECVRYFASYLGLGYIENPFVFKIPVYKNMASEYKFPSTGNPNNWLEYLKVESKTLFDDKSDKTEFELTIYDTVKYLNIDAKTIVSGASIKGNGKVELTDADKETLNVVVTAQNGATRTYKINITKEKDPHSETVNVNSVKNIEDLIGTDKYLSVKVGTSMDTLKTKFDGLDEKLEISFKDKDSNEKTEGVICSGDYISFKLGEEVKDLMIIIYGDITQDGYIDSADILMLRQYLLGQVNLTGAGKISATLVSGSTIDSADLLKLRQYLLGQVTLD